MSTIWILWDLKWVVATGGLVMRSVVVAAGALVMGSVVVAIVVEDSSFCQAGVLQTYVVGNFSICVVVIICRSDHLALTVILQCSTNVVGYPVFLEDLT